MMRGIRSSISYGRKSEEKDLSLVVILVASIHEVGMNGNRVHSDLVQRRRKSRLSNMVCCAQKPRRRKRCNGGSGGGGPTRSRVARWTRATWVGVWCILSGEWLVVCGGTACDGCPVPA